MKKFPSKIGWEIWVPVAVLFSILGVAMTVKGVWPGLIVLASVSMFITALIRNTDYTITSDQKLVSEAGFWYTKLLTLLISILLQRAVVRYRHLLPRTWVG